jgi:uncharacterized delta-60 repeat protein
LKLGYKSRLETAKKFRYPAAEQWYEHCHAEKYPAFGKHEQGGRMDLLVTVSLSGLRFARTVGSVLVVLTLVLGFGCVAVFAAAGDRDSSFDGDGIRIVARSGNDRGQAVAIQQNDGKIVVAGYTNIFGSNDVLVMRFNTNGSFDTTFNSGQPQVVRRTGDDRGQAVAIQSDGKIVVAGSTDVFGTTDLLVMRFNVNGSLDATFDNDGVFVLARSGTEFGRAIAIQSSGRPGEKIVVVGDTDTFGSKDVFVLRLNLNGSVDNSFAGAGTQIIRRTGTEQAEAVAVRANDRLVIAGTTDVLGTNDVFALQLNANGTLDGTFGDRGISIIDRTSDDRGNSVALRSDERIVVAGSTNVFGTTDFFVVQLTATGGLDQSFFPTRARRTTVRGGVRTIEQAGEDSAQAVRVQPDGKIVLAGSSTLFGLNDFMVVRLNPNGSLDTTFDRDGRQLAGPSGENRAQAVALQADQKIVVVGHTDTFDVSDIEVMRFLGQ